MNRIFDGFRRAFTMALAIATVIAVLAVPAQAAQESTPKEEVVYVNLDADGTVEEIYVVNIFDLKAGGRIVDYGSYEHLRNMTTTDAIVYDRDTVTIDAKAGKLYYEGKLNSNVIPWSIGIHYYMDGREYTAEEVAGMSGALKISIDISRNEESVGSFFDGFALQVTLVLDAEKCSNIVAKDATVANVGSDKQLTHTVMPGNSAQLEVTADVVDFSMDGISINAIPLNLNVEVDVEALANEITTLLDGIEKLDEGAGKLEDGVSDLQDSVQSALASGVDELFDGSGALVSGASDLRDGGRDLQRGARQLQNGAAALDEGIQTLNDGILKVQTALNTLHNESGTLVSGSAAYAEGLAQLQAALNGLSITSEDLSALTDASTQILSGITEIVNGADTLQQNISFAALKAKMAENGLDVDSLKQNNSAAMEALRTGIDENRELVEMLGKLGIDISDIFGQLEQVILLLGANNAFIDGTGVYLDAINGNMTTLVNGAISLQTNYALFDTEIRKLADAIASLPANLATLTNAVNTLVSEYSRIDGGISDYTGAVAEIVAGYTEIVNGAARLAASSGELENGAGSLYAGTGELLGGIAELCNGAGELEDGIGQLDSGVADLLTGIAALYDGSQELRSGTTAMLEGTSGMDEAIIDKVDELLASITGENIEMGSFVSEKNTEVQSVQFVIKTAGVQPVEPAQTAEPEEEPLSFWEKLLKLFGF